MQPTIRVLLADDHAVVRAGLRTMLGAAGDVEVVAEASTPEETVASAQRRSPDVVLMGLELGNGSGGVAATGALGRLRPTPRVLVLTSVDTDADIRRAVEAGAHGYLLKDVDPEQLVSAVRAAARGERVLTPDTAQRLASRLRAGQPELSRRELEVLKLVASGLANRAVAKELYISEATVKSHLVHVFTKLDVDSRTAAVAAARQHGLTR